ncbi:MULTISPECIES: BCCT family transporter [Shewanella]|uniref:Choline BCCT transporter BetT n=1 Tax=Shewanella indica TaxID=768528 RepID=A0ABU4QCR4_9GAMM|nr:MULTISPECIES: choline BCCT transporter BetT [Shewanella]MCL1160732.1 choline BCCT transporter BetT [Shewanella chilikensis]MDX6017221.1 choline BCCT transporter BetT [Shewanella indica]OIN14911.1 choline transporter [Shewanella algae]TVP08608.1 choline transporter [Shewanella sp. MSW]
MSNPTEVTKPRMAGINPPVFYPSAGLIVLFVLFTIAMPETAGRWFGSLQSWIIETFGWFYLLSMGFYLIVTLILAFSRFGKIKLGPDHSKPEYSSRSWFAMLFSAGMGIGLIFYGVAEPVFHFANPPEGEPQTVEAARQAMTHTFFHWGVHAWGVYAIVALALGYFSFRHGLPLRISSALYPIIGKRIYGPIGYAVDILAVFGTMFGIATSLGLGVLQINSGLNYLFEIPFGTLTQLVLIAIVTVMATLSVVTGLDNGIRRLSEWNLNLAAVLLIFVAITGPTLFIFQSLAQNVGSYISSLVEMTFNSYAYINSDKTNSFLGGWTLFYWAWFIAWSPFVGMFVARISRGRTIKEFVLGVLFVPVGVTIIWLTVFGNTALHGIMTERMPQLVEQVFANTPTSLFRFLDTLPLASISSVVATLLIFTFFVTSSDSGSLVIDTLTAKDGDETPAKQRIFWAVSEGLVAAALILAGGQNVLSALQAASLASALPFAPVLILVGFGLLKSLRQEMVKIDSAHHLSQATPSTLARIQEIGWQQHLEQLITIPEKTEVLQFLQHDIMAVMHEVADVFKQNGINTHITSHEHACSLMVDHGDERNFVYGAWAREASIPSFIGERSQSRPKSQLYIEVYLNEGAQQYNICGYNRNQLIADILDQYEKHLHFLNRVR